MNEPVKWRSLISYVLFKRDVAGDTPQALLVYWPAIISRQKPRFGDEPSEPYPYDAGSDLADNW